MQYVQSNIKISKLSGELYKILLNKNTVTINKDAKNLEKDNSHYKKKWIVLSTSCSTGVKYQDDE